MGETTLGGKMMRLLKVPWCMGASLAKTFLDSSNIFHEGAGIGNMQRVDSLEKTLMLGGIGGRRRRGRQRMR